jgi:hypothetical protein
MNKLNIAVSDGTHPVISALWRLRKENLGFEDSLDHTVRLSFKKKTLKLLFCLHILVLFRVNFMMLTYCVHWLF